MKYSDDSKVKRKSSSSKLPTDLDFEISEVKNSRVKYIFFRNFGEKIFIVYSDVKDINKDQIKSITNGVELFAVGINTKKDEENLKILFILKKLLLFNFSTK